MRTHYCSQFSSSPFYLLNGFVEWNLLRGVLEDLVTATGLLQPRDYVDVGAQLRNQRAQLMERQSAGTGADAHCRFVGDDR
ncbi:hypothetical protein LCGC14_2149900 [marine sediment metagenome]|uniref:Uncharacterized protein n=2 Tax=root TaxID=1 RepID=A0A831QYV7_9GAMM|nr:hypothetical protein [Marinobacter antarcticus]HEA51067.1 hypothetical protein [Marinobacter antarcticus]